jgi:hypothetical protein
VQRRANRVQRWHGQSELHLRIVLELTAPATADADLRVHILGMVQLSVERHANPHHHEQHTVRLHRIPRASYSVLRLQRTGGVQLHVQRVVSMPVEQHAYAIRRWERTGGMHRSTGTAFRAL